MILIFLWINKLPLVLLSTVENLIVYNRFMVSEGQSQLPLAYQISQGGKGKIVAEIRGITAGVSGKKIQSQKV